jgi:hypothetical protein
MITNSSLPVLQASDNSTYYLSLQPQSNINNKTSATYANPGLTFNPGSGVLNLNVANANMQGSVIQLQSFILSTPFTTAAHGGIGTASQPGSSGVDTPLTLSIKPKYVTSKILVSVKGSPGYSSAAIVSPASPAGHFLGVLKRSGTGVNTAYSPASGASSMINSWSVASDFTGSGVGSITMFAFDWIDTPNTTATLTYTLRIASNVAGALVGIGVTDIFSYGVNSWGSACTITAMEIGQ